VAPRREHRAIGTAHGVLGHRDSVHRCGRPAGLVPVMPPVRFPRARGRLNGEAGMLKRLRANGVPRVGASVRTPDRWTNDPGVRMTLSRGLYDPAFEHDACGVAFVATMTGQPTHEIVQQALTALTNLEHRGA